MYVNENLVTKRLKPVMPRMINSKTRQLGGPDPADLPVKVPKGRQAMIRNSQKWTLPLSVTASLSAVVVGSGLGVVYPSTLMCHLGWAVALTALATLLISLARMLWVVLDDRRTEYYSREAFEALRAADEPPEPAVDFDEWRREIRG